MAKYSEQIRSLERKYLRKKRALKWKSFCKKLPLRLSVILLTAAAIFAVWFMTKPRPVPIPADTLRVYILDVGQGDAALLRTDSHSVLIDGGEPDYGPTVVRMLQKAGVEQLDCIINSHPHSDHIGGIAAVLEQIPVGALYLPKTPEAWKPTGLSYTNVLDLAEEKQIPIITPACHETLSLGAAELEFLCADDASLVDLNDCSLVCRVTCGERRFLFTGDLSAAGEQAMLSKGYALSADVLKIGHHGSSQSTTPDFLAAVSPDYAAISCGAMNDYGHPAPRILNVLRDAACAVYRTDFDHTILFETDGDRLSVISDYDFGHSGTDTYEEKEPQSQVILRSACR